MHATTVLSDYQILLPVLNTRAINLPTAATKAVPQTCVLSRNAATCHSPAPSFRLDAGLNPWGRAPCATARDHHQRFTKLIERFYAFASPGPSIQEGSAHSCERAGCTWYRSSTYVSDAMRCDSTRSDPYVPAEERTEQAGRKEGRKERRLNTAREGTDSCTAARGKSGAARFLPCSARRIATTGRSEHDAAPPARKACLDYDTSRRDSETGII
ncbi:hypothetical protein SVAN01_04928 [Stagonosporopsis vannaccii]|nr:hypothetical protein SVAN01_04928 [Stagonosporopsis vannaccii]